MFILEANKTQLTLKQREPVTSGSVNVYAVRFEFSEDWAGLERMAVFRAGDTSRSVLLNDSGETLIPREVLKKPNTHFLCGVYGTSSGDIVLPTRWADMGIIWQGTEPAEEGAQPPTPDIWRQRLDAKADALNYDGLNLSLLSGDKTLSTVQIMGGGENGEFVPVPGKDGKGGQDGFSPVVKLEREGNSVDITIIDAAGPHTETVYDGQPGEPGKPGISPTVEVESADDGHRVTITDETGDHEFIIKDGKQGPPGEKGQDGKLSFDDLTPEQKEELRGEPGLPGVDGYSPTVDVKQTENGHIVTITDKSGPKEFPVKDGKDGEPGPAGENGISASVSVSPITGGHEVTVTSASGIDSFKVMDGSRADIYSIEETRIGTWINGKPLYRIVGEAITNSQTGVWKTVLQEIPNVEIKKIDGYIDCDGVITHLSDATDGWYGANLRYRKGVGL